MGRAAAILVSGLALAATTAPSTPAYDPSADGWRQLVAAGSSAARDGKRVLVVVGGNWCPWCRALDRLMRDDASLAARTARFEVVHLNWSKENKNLEAMAHLGHPEKLGFPSLLVLAPDMKVLATQETGVFETGDPKRPAHDPAKLRAFLDRWAPRR